jgi:putative SOS response-associated peptidase YedK
MCFCHRRREVVSSERHQPPIDLLRPFPAEEMETFEVNEDVGNVRNNSLELLNNTQRTVRADSITD